MLRKSQKGHNSNVSKYKTGVKIKPPNIFEIKHAAHEVQTMCFLQILCYEIEFSEFSKKYEYIFRKKLGLAKWHKS